MIQLAHDAKRRRLGPFNPVIAAALALLPACAGQLIMVAAARYGVVSEWAKRYILPLFANIGSIASRAPFAVAPWLALALVLWIVIGLAISVARSIYHANAAYAAAAAIRRAAVLSALYFLFVIGFGVMYQAPRTFAAQSVSGFPYARYLRRPLSEASENWIRLANILNRRAIARNAVSMDAESVTESIAASILEQIPAMFERANAAIGSGMAIRAPKPSGLNGLLGSLMVEGIYVPFTGEALVNTDAPLIDIPFVACHEAAHSIGFAREDEANLVALIVCGMSDNPLFRYSGAMSALRYSLTRLCREDMAEYNRLVSLMSDNVRSDFYHRNAYWGAKRGSSAAVFANHLNDIFLSYAAMQENGVASYEAVLDFTR